MVYFKRRFSVSLKLKQIVVNVLIVRKRYKHLKFTLASVVLSSTTIIYEEIKFHNIYLQLCLVLYDNINLCDYRTGLQFILP